MDHDPARESRLRRLAKREGYVLRKSRARDPQVRHYGRWFIVEANRNLLMTSEHGLDLEEVEKWLRSG